MAKNVKYSGKDYTNTAHRGLDLSDAEGSEIHNSCFYVEEGANDTGPPFLNLNALGAKNITFVRCNMDNCLIPPSCTLVECSNRMIRPNNGKDWLCNESGVFVEELKHV